MGGLRCPRGWGNALYLTLLMFELLVEIPVVERRDDDASTVTSKNKNSF